MLRASLSAGVVSFALMLSSSAAAQAPLQQALERAHALRERALEAVQQDDRAAASALVKEALAELERADGADRDADAAQARWLLALCAFQAGDSETEVTAWEKAAAYYRRRPEDGKYAREALRNQAAALGRLGRHREALAIQERIHEEWRGGTPDAEEFLRTRWDLAVTLNNLKRSPEAAALWEEIVAELVAREPVDEDELLLALDNQATAFLNTGERAKQEAVRREIVTRLERLGRLQTEAGQDARLALAWTLYWAGLYAEAANIVREVHDEVGPGETPRHFRLRSRLGFALWSLGEREEARRLLEEAVAGLRRLLPPTAAGWLGRAELWLAQLLEQMGERQASIELLTDLDRRGQERLSPHSGWRLNIAHNLARMWRLEGDLERARRILEAALATYEQSTLPSESTPNETYQRARLVLGDTLRALGDLAGALGIYESVLEAREAILPDDDRQLTPLRRAIASTRWDLGDFAGARPIYQKIHDVLAATREEDDPELAGARIALGACLGWLGDLDSYLALNRAAEAALRNREPRDIVRLLTARFNIGAALSRKAQYADAAPVLEGILEAVADRDQPGWIQYHTQGELGHVLWRLGETARAEELLRSGLEGLELLAHGNPSEAFHVARLRRHLLSLLSGSGRAEALSTEVNALLRSLRLRARTLVPLSMREIAEGTRVLRWDLDAALSVVPSDSPGFDAALFGVAETLRAMAGPPEVDRFFSGGAELFALREKAMQSRARLNDMVAGSQDGELPAPDPAAISLAVRERDRAERELRAAFAGSASTDLSAELVFEALGRNTAAASFLLHTRLGEVGSAAFGRQRLLAFVLTPDRRVQRVDLGPAEEIDELVARWRAAIGKPLVRGLPLDDDAGTAAELGLALRRKVLDPVLERAGGAKKLYLCLDGALHLVPLDALPLGEDLVGDAHELVLLPSFRPLVAPRSRTKPGPSLFALGGVAFNAELSGRFASDERSAAGGPGGEIFRPLPATLEEARSLGALFTESFGAQPELYTGAAATKEVLLERVGGARWLHLATHGYFAPELAAARPDPASGPYELGFAEAVRGLAPSTLCGLALAGANRGRDSLGRVPGILTAEELAGLDLRRCELAVLSACETSVGIERSGQGIQSLQAALHAAGVGTAITSLWQVGDDATRDLMLDFYHRLWVQKKEPARALWEAKAQMRKRGAPEREWAGWVLTGRR